MDTNTFVSALIRDEGASREVLKRRLRGRLEPLMGPALFAEYGSVLGRDALFRRSPLDVSQRETVLDAFLSACRWTRIHYLWRPNLRDEAANNHAIELGVAGRARAIVTKNIRDFRAAELQFRELQVLEPEALLEGMDRWER